MVYGPLLLSIDSIWRRGLGIIDYVMASPFSGNREENGKVTQSEIDTIPRVCGLCGSSAIRRLIRQGLYCDVVDEYR